MHFAFVFGINYCHLKVKRRKLLGKMRIFLLFISTAILITLCLASERDVKEVYGVLKLRLS